MLLKSFARKAERIFVLQRITQPPWAACTAPHRFSSPPSRLSFRIPPTPHPHHCICNICLKFSQVGCVCPRLQFKISYATIIHEAERPNPIRQSTQPNDRKLTSCDDDVSIIGERFFTGRSTKPDPALAGKCGDQF